MIRRRTRSAYIFVQALVLIAGLVAVVGMLAADENSYVDQVQHRLRERRADQAANAAIQRALAEVQAANSNIVTTIDDWAKLGDSGNEAFEINNDGTAAGSTSDATFRMQIVDAASQVNLNTATLTQLLLLPLTQEQADCLLDWRSPNTQARSDGAKDEYYTTLTTPYNTKLGLLTTLDEAMLIKDWTTQTLYQPFDSQNQPSTQLLQGWPTDQYGGNLPLASVVNVDSGSPNTRADGLPRINLSRPGVNINTILALGIPRPLAMAIVARPITNFAQLFTIPGMNPAAERTLLNSVTFSTTTRNTGLINLNTASQAALETVPGFTSDIASTIVNQQSSGFQTLGAITNISALSAGVLRQAADSLSIGSDTWIVRAYGSSGGVNVAYEAVIRKQTTGPQIITMQRLNTTTIPAWWGWTDTTTSNVDPGSEQ